MRSNPFRLILKRPQFSVHEPYPFNPIPAQMTSTPIQNSLRMSSPQIILPFLFQVALRMNLQTELWVFARESKGTIASPRFDEAPGRRPARLPAPVKPGNPAEFGEQVSENDGGPVGRIYGAMEFHHVLMGKSLNRSVVWLPFFIFPSIGNNHPNWLSYFSEGWRIHQPVNQSKSWYSMGHLIAMTNI